MSYYKILALIKLVFINFLFCNLSHSQGFRQVLTYSSNRCHSPANLLLYYKHTSDVVNIW